MFHSRTRTAAIWNYFDIVNAADRKAECNLCKNTLSYKSTITNLKLHLKQKHIQLYEKFCISEAEQKSANGARRRFHIDYITPRRPEAQLKKCWDSIKSCRKGRTTRSLSPDRSRTSPQDEGLGHLPSDPLTPVKQDTSSLNGGHDNDSDASSKEFQVAEETRSTHTRHQDNCCTDGEELLGAATSLPHESRLADNEFSTRPASQKQGSDPDERNHEMMEELHKLKVAEQVWKLKTLRERHAITQLERQRAQFERQRAHEESEKAKLEREKARFERDVAEYQREKALLDLNEAKGTHTVYMINE